MKGNVFAIERCSLHDGPGIRTTVFLKGCPLRCLWCHNPESQDARRELYFLHERCVACGACVEVCRRGVHELIEADGGVEHRIDRDACELCGRCVSACLAGALEIKGREMEVSEVLAEIERDRDYYESSGGGMTLSGGEPMAQVAFSLALLDTARNAGLHTCVETSGYATTEHCLEFASRVDLFLYDWKETHPRRHEQFTGVDNERIRANLLALDTAGAAIVLRCPIVPGCNDRPDHFCGIAELANELANVQGIEIMPYHPMGRAKSERIGKTCPLPEVDFPEEEEAEAWRAAVRERTAVPVS